jgi:xanthine dehydrogenase YagS FAD-binding subunit
MRSFTYLRAGDDDRAVHAAGLPDATFVAGGTNVVDLLRIDVLRPALVVDVTGLQHAGIEATASGGVRIGALARNSTVADHPLIRERYPVLAEALASGASPQLRNMATVGGNLLQRTRCPYFRDVAARCNKRQPGSGCAAMAGFARTLAVLGTSSECLATHPSDMCVALVALDAVVHTRRPSGDRAIPIGELHTLPGARPDVEHTLERGELITDVELPPSPAAKRSVYVKVRDRAEFAFALASAAVALDIVADRIAHVRIALGGVATKPWRAHEAEEALLDRAPTVVAFERAAAAALGTAKALPDNAFKIELAKRTIVRALSRAAGVGVNA